jgi:superfamily II DNA or RNA helicase
MRIELGNVDARLVAATPEERAWLREYLTFDDPQARFVGDADRFVELLAIDGTFPAGLVGKVRAAAKKMNPPIPLEVVDPRGPGPYLDLAAGLGWLFDTSRLSTIPLERRPAFLTHAPDYQWEAVQTIGRRSRGIVKVPTGGGKTELMAGVTRLYPHARHLIIVPQKDLLRQTADRVHLRTGETCGLLGDGIRDVRRITVATFQTLHRALTKDHDEELKRLVASVDVLQVDECHTLGAGSLYLVLRSAVNAYVRVGYSGTPLARGDKRSLFVVAMLGSVIVDISAQELIAKGVLSRSRIRMRRVTQGSNAPTWQGVYGECIVRSKKRNRVIVEEALAVAKPALVFVSQVGHGRRLLPELQRAGLRSALVWGDHDTAARKRAITSLERRDLDVIVCSAVFQQAVDIPGLAGAVNAGGGASTIAAVQKLGRGSRITATKTEFEFRDIFDDGHRWLERHSEERRDAYENEGHEVVVADDADTGEDIRRDEHGHVLGSKAQAKARTAMREETNLELTGAKKVRNGARGTNGTRAPTADEVDW